MAELERLAQPRARNGEYASPSYWAVLWTRFKAWTWKWFVRLMWALAVGSAAAGIFVAGSITTPKEVTVVNQQMPAAKESMAIVMQRIAGCESEGSRNAKGKQFNADGSIVTHVNADGTTDVGKYQINMQKAHIVNMARLGLNPFTEEGNEAYAKWLYENKGTGDWLASANCWR